VTPFTLLVWVATCLIWSTVWLFIKIGVRDVPPVTFAAFRLAIALIVLVPITVAQRLSLPRARRDYVLIASTGVVLLGVNYALLNWGIQFVSSGLTAVLQAMTPAFGMVFAHFMLSDERMTRVKTAALLLGIAGVAMIFSDQLDFAGSRALQGSVAIVGGAICVAGAYVMMRRYGSDLHPSIITSGQMFSALVPLLAYATWREGNPLAVTWTSSALASVVYLALLGSVTGAWLNYWLLKRIGATRLLLMGLIEPLVAVVLGAAFLDETLTGRALVGGVLILVGLAFSLEVWRISGRGAGPHPSSR
jgi:drug/metabolite transporter (DMT)-like permease